MRSFWKRLIPESERVVEADTTVPKGAISISSGVFGCVGVLNMLFFLDRHARLCSATQGCMNARPIDGRGIMFQQHDRHSSPQ